MRSFFTFLKETVESNESKSARFFNLFIQGLIFLSLILFSIETLPNLSPPIKEVLSWCEISIIFIFLCEYLLRLLVVDKKLKFIFSIPGIIDAIAIVPFFLTGADFRTIRILRMIRLFHVLKLLRYNQAIQNLKDTFNQIKEELVVFLFISFLVLYLTSIGIYYFEHEAQPEVFGSIFHSLWWAVITLTTVGYGDTYPITTGGKVFTSLILIIGIGVISIPTGLMASAFSRTKDKGR